MRRFCLGLLAVSACTRAAPSPEPPSAPLPPLTATEPTTIAELCADASERAWTVLHEARDVAWTRGACLGREAAGFHLVSQLGSPSTERPDYELHLWLDEKARPQLAQLRTGVATAYYRFGPDGLTVSLHGDDHPVAFDRPRDDVWVLPSHAVFLRESMLRLGVGRAEQGILQLGFAPELGAIVPLPLQADGYRALVVAPDRARFVLAPGTSRLGDLRVLEVLVSGAAVYRQRDGVGGPMPAFAEIPTPTYVAPADLRLESLSLPGQGGTPSLGGELVTAGESPSPRPGVVFVSSTGPQDRHGFVPGTSIDTGAHEIHDALARAGFAVLRLDDRGVGESERGDDATPGFSAQVEDARRALAFLRSRPEIDPKRLVVLGHGEGALVASIVAGERRNGVVGLVLVSPAARNARELIYWQLRRSLADQEPARVEAAVAAARALHEAVMAGRELPAQSEPMRDWMAEIFREDPIARLRRVRVPVLALAGAKDFQTDPEVDFRSIADLLARSGAAGSDSRLFADLDHLLKPEPGRSSVGHYGDLSRRVDPQALAYLGEWCRRRAGLREPPP